MEFVTEHCKLLSEFFSPSWYFPGGPVVKSPPSSVGLIPGRGTKIPHAMEQLSPCTPTTELMYPGACGPQLEKPVCCNAEPTCHSEDLIQNKQKRTDFLIWTMMDRFSRTSMILFT